MLCFLLNLFYYNKKLKCFFILNEKTLKAALTAMNKGQFNRAKEFLKNIDKSGALEHIIEKSKHNEQLDSEILDNYFRTEKVDIKAITRIFYEMSKNGVIKDTFNSFFERFCEFISETKNYTLIDHSLQNAEVSIIEFFTENDYGYLSLDVLIPYSSEAKKMLNNASTVDLLNKDGIVCYGSLYIIPDKNEVSYSCEISEGTFEENIVKFDKPADAKKFAKELQRMCSNVNIQNISVINYNNYIA